jgi:iron complex outermembrane receptor protein
LLPIQQVDTGSEHADALDSIFPMFGLIMCRIRYYSGSRRVAPNLSTANAHSMTPKVSVAGRGSLALLFAPVLLAAAGPAARAQDITALSLEELSKLEVVTASRKAQAINDTPAAAFVITAEDIRRSGATTLPDVLRMVPGVQVAQIAAGRWAVTSRGFNGRFTNALLVQLDGRTLYSPLFSGVMWEAQDVPLELIDRIEVIRGPGAAMWGANAVNGVISIITKNSRRTQGGLVDVAAGSWDRGIGGVRYGGALDESTSWRAYGYARNRGGASDSNGDSSSDSWRTRRAGFRLDSAAGSGDRIALSGDALEADARDEWDIPSLVPPYIAPAFVTQKHQGSNLLGRWERALDSGDEIALQAFIDRTRFEADSFIVETRTTYDLDFQHRLRVGSSHDLIWGFGYRNSQDDISTMDIASGGLFSIAPAQRGFTLASLFLHDDITLLPERLRLMIGARVERNNFSGVDRQPSARLLWTPAAGHTVWGALSHAVRTPSRSELDATINLETLAPGSAENPGPLPVLVQAAPSGNARNERLYATELGYRVLLEPSAALDLAVFRNRYDHRSSAVLGTATPVFGPTPYVLQPALSDWTGTAATRGVEASLDWHPLAVWRLQTSYTRLLIDIPEASTLTGQGDRRLAIGTSPRHQVSLRSRFDASSRWQIDVWLRHVGELDYGSIPAYTALDLRLGWRPRKDFELTFVGQNLLERRHAEFFTDLLNAPLREVPRTGYVKAQWRF